jgi:hypothetical protein
MNIKKIFSLLGLLLAFMMFIASEGMAQPQPKPGTEAPIITHAFAPEKGRYGDVLRIYIEAEDPDGDMSRIAVVVEQLGYGRYPADWTLIKSQYRHHLIGYLQWNTFSSRTAFLREWTQITIKVSIFDKAGNESNEVVFPFEFVSNGRHEIKLPPPFDQGVTPRLGHIMIDLYEPTLMGDGIQRDD